MLISQNAYETMVCKWRAMSKFALHPDFYDHGIRPADLKDSLNVLGGMLIFL